MMPSIQTLACRLIKSEPTLEIQLLETGLIAVAFGFIFPFATRACTEYCRTRPWYDFVSNLHREGMERNWGFSPQQSVVDKLICSQPIIYAQHFFVGMLCLPALLGLGVPREVSLCLVRHGALCELGWEIADTCERLVERFFTASGMHTQPSIILKIFLTHHVLQFCFAIPMNLHYSHLPAYHEIMFLLEAAAAFAGVIGFYGYTLDTSKRPELRQMILCNVLNLVIMVYTRWGHYWWSLYKCLTFFYTEGALICFVFGIICGGFFMPGFALLFIPEQISKVWKFMKLYLASSGSNDINKKVADMFPSLLQSGSKADPCSKSFGNKNHDD